MLMIIKNITSLTGLQILGHHEHQGTDKNGTELAELGVLRIKKHGA
jgi:hypothetical protein